MTEQQREQAARDRERAHEWDRQPYPKSRERERDANEEAYWRAVAEIPNPGPVEPLTELQAFHAEQTDPPPGPYPDPPLGPYPDPVIKERPSEDIVYGTAGTPVRDRLERQRSGSSARSERSRQRPRDTRARGVATVDRGGREYDEPNFDGYEPDIHERAEGPPGATYGQSADNRKPANRRAAHGSQSAAHGSGERSRSGEAGREAGPEDGGHAGRSAADRPADRPGER